MNKLRGYLTVGWNWLGRVPCTPMLLLTLGCLVVWEQYPFSNFPIYSSFYPSTY